MFICGLLRGIEMRGEAAMGMACGLVLTSAQVKADRGDATASAESIKKLQEETAKIAGEKSRT
jgi:hypothetical protein